MLGEPPDGILHLLDFMCKAPKATDSTFCVAINAKRARSRQTILPDDLAR